MHAPESEKDRWLAIREQLTADFSYDNNWSTATLIFKDRLENKFFKPVSMLLNKGSGKGEGFVILPILCALTEMLAAFREGMIFNHAKNAASPPYEYSTSKKLFVNFLQTANIFKEHFWTNNKGDVQMGPFDAQDFYASVRCGLLHEARTKGNWLIRTYPRGTNRETENTFIVRLGNDYIIYRTVYYHRLLHYIREYLQELAQENAEGILLRKYFARKMDDLFDIGADPAFHWWR